jgi:hypothetical protein
MDGGMPSARRPVATALVTRSDGVRLVWCAVARDPLTWSIAALVFLVFGMNALRPLFAAAFPELQRPIFEQDSFVALTAAHLALVALSSAASIVAGVAAGIFVTYLGARVPAAGGGGGDGQTILPWPWPSPSSDRVRKCRP